MLEQIRLGQDQELKLMVGGGGPGVRKLGIDTKEKFMLRVRASCS